MDKLDKVLPQLMLVTALGVFCVLQSTGSVVVFCASLFIYAAQMSATAAKIQDGIDVRLVSILAKHDEVNKEVQELKKELASMNKLTNLKKMGL